MNTSALDVTFAAKSLEVLLLSKYVRVTPKDIKTKIIEINIANVAWIMWVPAQHWVVG